MIFHEYSFRRGRKKKEEEERKKDPTHILSIITAIPQKQKWFKYLMRLASKASEWHDTQTEQKQNKK